MMSTFHMMHKRALSLCLSLTLIFSMTACGNSLVNQTSPEPVKSETVSIDEVIKITKGKVKTKDRKAVDFSSERFQIEGDIAFYILPGLENIPDAMASFEVLDYNSRGEFVYYYVTPCYITPEELSKYNKAPGNYGSVSDRSSLPEPDGRREDYTHDAVVLMAYNPDTGVYRVMYANAYEIDKENEFDPAKEGRPYYYQFLSEREDSTYRAYITERAFGCKVAGREQYLFMDQGGFTGRVYDIYGNVLTTMTYKPTLDNEIDNKRNSLNVIRQRGTIGSEISSSDMKMLNAWNKEQGRDKVSGSRDKDQMNALISGIAMTEGYETYLGVTFFLGDELFDSDTVQLSTTYMIYYQPLNEEEGGVPYISVNSNADKQRETWMSLDGQFFLSREEYEAAPGYSFEKMKRGEKGRELADNFTPFIAGNNEGNASVLLEIPDVREVPGSWRDEDYSSELITAARLEEAEELRLNWYITDYEGEFDREYLTPADRTFMDYARNYMSEAGKKVLQNIIADSILRAPEIGSDLTNVIRNLIKRGWIPSPGEYVENEDSGYNKQPEGFYDPEDEEDLGVALVSDHTLSVVSVNGVYKTYVSPVSYFPDNEDAASRRITAESGVKMEPYEMSKKQTRAVYVYDIPLADREKEELIREGGLSDSVRDAIDEITLLLRTPDETWENAELFWFINEITGKDMEDILDDLMDEADEAYDDNDISDKEYEYILDLYERIDDELDEQPEDIFEELRADVEEKYDEGDISYEEYKEIMDIIDKAEEDEEDLSEEEREVYERLIYGSRLINDVKNAIGSSKDIRKQEILDRIDELSKVIPEDIRENMLILCAGFSINIEEMKEVPVSYKVTFPTGAAVTVRENGQAETVGGKIDSFREGVLVAAECEGSLYNGNSFLVGYKRVGTMDLFSPYSYGKPVDVTTLEYSDGKEIRTIVVLCTDKGVRFYEKGSERMNSDYDLPELESMLGEDYADLVYRTYEEENNGENWGVYNSYSPLTLGERGKEAYKAAKEEGLKDSVSEKDFEGFMTYRMLLTSTGYTREAENRLTEAVEEGLERLSASENTAEDSVGAPDISNAKADLNERYTGHLSSAKNISMISKDKALISSIGGGTKILDLNFGTVADDMTGSYFRAFQQNDTTTFKLIGFGDNEFSYIDSDLPRSKVYTLEYSTIELDRSVIEAFKNMLKQYAEDYLYREYRTRIDDNDELVLKEKTKAEEEESVEAGKIFDPSNNAFDAPLRVLEKKYGIVRDPGDIKAYVKELRERIKAVGPGITRIYELAGAKKLAGDKLKRNSGYYKNLESRITMAVENDALYDILVEIRMHDDVLPELDSEQAKKYRSYKPVLDYSKEQGKVSADEIFRQEETVRSEEEVENDRLKQMYRQDVLNDIIEEYVSGLNKTALSGEETELTAPEKKELFDNYLRTLLDQVNPENFALDSDKTAEEFIGIINHGKESLSGARFDEMSERIKEELPAINAVWLLEEMLITEKVENEGSYSEYREWLKDYKERVDAAANKENGLKIPINTEGDKVEDPSSSMLSGKERIRYLRTSPAYRAVIGDIKGDSVVKEFLSGRRETWYDYCKYVIKKSGAGVIMDESGYVEGSGISEVLKETTKPAS